MRLYAFGPRLFGLRTGVSFGPEDFGRRREFGERSVVPRAREAAGSDDEFIYVLRGDHGLFKIGISRNPLARLATLRTASPFHLEMVYVAVTQGPAKRLEQAAHDALEKHRIVGDGVGIEWFDCPLSYCVAAINGAACDIGQPIQAAPMNVSPEQYVMAIFKRVATGQTGLIAGPRKRGLFMRLFIYAILLPAVFVIFFLATCIIYALVAHAADQRTDVEKAFCSGVELQRTTDKINMDLIHDALERDGSPLAEMFGSQMESKIMGVDSSFGSFKCKPADAILFAPPEAAKD
jgi:Meiotically up-regulated gene 113